jgi:hypothetical protein
MDGGAEVLMAESRTGSDTAPWIQPGHVYVFRLYAETTHTTLLASVTVNGLRPSGTIATTPWTDVICQPGQLGSVTITWSTAGCGTAQVYVAMDGGAETLMAQSTSGNDTAPWIQANHYYDFKLYAETSHAYVLGTVRIYGRTYEYLAGVCYHSTGANFDATTFITQYTGAGVRTTVQAQLQGMANAGATYIKTAIWMVSTQQGYLGASWKSHFPLNATELANLRLFAQDVAAVQATDGHRLRLDISLGGIWASDYTTGTPQTTLGAENLSPATFLSYWTSAYQGVINSVFDVTRPDGVKVVNIVYLEGEVMIGAKTNEEWFLLNLYPNFVAYANSKGITPSLYFLVAGAEEEIMDVNFIDPEFPTLNGHRSMFWVYRSVKFLHDNGLQMPARIDWSCYINKVNYTYAILSQVVFDDADATLPSVGARKWYGVAETYYFTDQAQRRSLGLAFAAQRNINNRLSRVEFWTTPNGGGEGFNIGYPFSVADYLP